MRWLRPELLEGASPWGLLVGGVLVGTAGLPMVRKILRGLAVGVIKGGVKVGEEAKELSQKMSREWAELMEEVKEERTKEQEGWQEKFRRAEVEAIKKGIDIAGKTKGKIENMKEKVGGLIEEARKEIDTAGTPTYAEKESNLPAGEARTETPRSDFPKREEEI